MRPHYQQETHKTFNANGTPNTHIKSPNQLHKPDNQIRPVINNMHAPSYKIAKHIINKLNGYLGHSNYYNAKKSISLAEHITKLKINENHKVII